MANKNVPKETLSQEVWRKVILALEADLMRACPTLLGGRKKDESCEQYARRGIAETERALGRLQEAKEAYRKSGGKP